MSDTANTKNIDLPVGFETDPREDKKAREKLITARVGMLIRSPWFGVMTVRLPLVNADQWLPTAATDGRHFFYNSKFINMLTDKELIFLVGHEVLHNVYDHLGRSRALKHNPQLANIAADYVVNRDLKLNSVGEMITTVPALYDKKYDGWTMEEVYNDLYENADKIDIQDLLDQLLDEHLDSDGQDGGDGDAGIERDENGNMKSTKKPVYSKEERKKIREELKTALINSQNQARSAGNTPHGVMRMIKELTEPKIDWRELLESNLVSMMKNDYTFMRQSRKGRDTGIILPGMVPEETVSVCIAVDMSGSISDEQARDFFGEIKGIMEMFSTFKLELWCFDAEVHNYAKFNETNLEDIMDYQPKGGGGTDFMVNWKFMEDNEIEPERFVMFTDGYPCGKWGIEDYCDTVFIIHGPDSIVPPFGEYAHYDGKRTIEGAQAA